MTYPKLLLSTGGGIISQIQQAEQVENTATVLIGLGGTGIDCLREVKQAVRERLMPDNPDELIPKYDHIRFLAVDTDGTDISGFDKNEVFDISNPNVKQALRSEIAIKNRSELDWLDPKKIDGADIGDAGAGGFRQAGRYMMVDKSAQFLNRIRELIQQAKRGAGRASLYIHIFAGIGGGTGSGTFLDVCYLVKKAIAEVNGGDGIVLGYFFLPDVNLSRIPSTASLVRTYVPKNGYAAMQELDYCMRLPENGGSFTQIYGNGVRVDWNEAPVHLCHLISATDRSYQVVPNAYNNAMKVTAEYVMDFLTRPDEGTHAESNEVGVTEKEVDAAESKFSIKSHLANFSGMVVAADGLKTHGYHLRYLVIGASCASIPMREINTYLTAKVFEAFVDLENHVPTENEVKAIADRTRVSNADALLTEITANGGGGDLAVVPEVYGLEFARDNGDKQLVEHYTNQRAEKVGVLETNAKSMMDEKNVNSLLGRICRELDACVSDLSRGPAYAYKVVQASFAGNLLNVIDGTIENVRSRRRQKYYNVYEQPGNYKEDYEQSRQIWYAEKDRGGLFGKPSGRAKRAFNQYVLDLEQYIRGQIEVEQLDKLLQVLNTVKEQVSRKADTYYLKFSRVMANLMETFHENYQALEAGTDEEKDSLFAIPLIRISEIRPSLDAAVEALDMPGVLTQFVHYMFTPGSDGKICWEDEDDGKITKAVKNFFINNIFSGFANKSITSFLFDKYGTNNQEEVKNRLYRDYITRLKDRSEALFPVDSMIYHGLDNEIAYISVPSTAAVIIDAATELHNQYNQFSVKKSALKDRIYIMRCACALPLASYANGELYETSYYLDLQPGRHYYIGQGGCELFNNWHDMLPLRPQSLIERDKLPDRARKLLDAANKTYDDAVAAKLFKESSIMRASAASVANLEAAYAAAEAEEAKAKMNPGKAEIIYQTAAGRLKAALDGIVYEESPYQLPAGNADEEIAERIRKDYFISSPALHTAVRREIEKLNKYREKYEELNGLASQGSKGKEELKAFAMALFTGVIAWDKRFSLTYNKLEYGMPTPTPLNDFTQPDKFKYAKLPLYQAFQTYKNVDADSKAAIAAEANQKYAGMTPDVIANFNACEAAITPAFVQGQMTMAATFPEIAEDARQFMGVLMQEMKATAETVHLFG